MQIALKWSKLQSGYTEVKNDGMLLVVKETHRYRCYSCKQLIRAYKWYIYRLKKNIKMDIISPTLSERIHDGFIASSDTMVQRSGGWKVKDKGYTDHESARRGAERWLAKRRGAE